MIQIPITLATPEVIDAIEREYPGEQISYVIGGGPIHVIHSAPASDLTLEMVRIVCNQDRFGNQML